MGGVGCAGGVWVVGYGNGVAVGWEDWRGREGALEVGEVV